MNVQQQPILDDLVSDWREPFKFNLMPRWKPVRPSESPQPKPSILQEMAQAALVELHRRQAGPSGRAGSLGQSRTPRTEGDACVNHC